MNDGRDSPVFVVGTPRSGTTLTAQILGRHSRIFMCGENHFFEDIYSRWRRLGELDDPRAREKIIGRMSTIYKKYNQLPDQERMDRLLSNPAVMKRLHACRDPRALLTAFMQVQIEGTGKSRWGNNVPKDIFHVDPIRDLYPRAKILVCVRDVRDFLVSYKNRWTVTTAEHRQRLKDLYHPILTSLLWKSTVRRIPFVQARVGKGDFMIVRYETLVQDPESTVRAICAVLEEEYEPEMLNVETNNSSDSIKETGIYTVSVGRWRGRLPNEEARIAQWLNRKELEKLSYPLESLPVRPGKVLRLAISFPYALGRALAANKNMRGPILPYLARRAVSLLPRLDTSPVPSKSNRED